MRNAIVIISTVVVLAVLSWLVFQKEQTVKSGRTVLLQLAPVDPRSLMQGDYMTLRYKVASELTKYDIAEKGRIVLKLDPTGVGQYVRIDDGTPLQADECLLIYRRRGELRLGAESFFFQEGDANLYESARYGELKVDPKGNGVLIGLRNDKLEFLGERVVK